MGTRFVIRKTVTIGGFFFAHVAINFEKDNKKYVLNLERKNCMINSLKRIQKKLQIN